MSAARELLTGIAHPGLGYLFVAVLAVSLLILRFKPGERRPLFNTLLFYLASLITLVAAALFQFFDFVTTAGTLREIAVLAEGMALIRLAGMFLFHILLPLIRLTPPSILEDILVILGYLGWAMLRLHEAGLDLSGIVTTSAVITAVIAFSMQDTLGNILGGLALQLDNSIKLGDWIRVGDVSGKVSDIRWRSTSIETRNWETVVIPNSVLMKNQFTVLGKRSGMPEQWRRWVRFNISYEVPPERVIQVVEEAMDKSDIAGVAATPRPNCVMLDFDSSSARYALRYWLEQDLAVDDPTDSMVRQHIFAALVRADMLPAIPRQQVHMVKESEKLATQRHDREIEQRLRILDQIDLFQVLKDGERQLLAERLNYSPYVKGDIITRQGDIAHWLYILFRGHAEIRLEVPGEAQRTLSTIDAGEGGAIVGEMGLMTGEPRSATVVAIDNVRSYRLDKSSFEDILQARPLLAEDLSHIMARRRTALSSAQQDIDAESLRRLQETQQSEMLQKIRQFFHLDA